jgi:hypothetical protein
MELLLRMPCMPYRIDLNIRLLPAGRIGLCRDATRAPVRILYKHGKGGHLAAFFHVLENKSVKSRGMGQSPMLS